MKKLSPIFLSYIFLLKDQANRKMRDRKMFNNFVYGPVTGFCL